MGRIRKRLSPANNKSMVDIPNPEKHRGLLANVLVKIKERNLVKRDINTLGIQKKRLVTSLKEKKRVLERLDAGIDYLLTQVMV